MVTRKYLPVDYSEVPVDLRVLNLLTIKVEDFIDGIACDKDSLSLDAFSQQVLTAALRVGHQNIAAVIDQTTICLLRYSVIVAAIARFHVKNRNTHSLHHDGCQAAIGVA